MSGEFFGQFIDDYHAECDEHLAAIRHALLNLEERGRDAVWDGETLRGVFRNLHTLKGLSGMVGFADAERLAHAMEEWLRSVSRSGAPADSDALELLFSGTRLLETSIERRRAGADAPDLAAYLASLSSGATPERLKAATPEPSTGRVNARTDSTRHASASASLPRSEEARVEAALQRGATLLAFDFLPTPELAARGIGVEGIRQRLQSLGELIHGSPRVLNGGKVAFHFIVALPHPVQVDDAWQADGLSWAPHPRTDQPTQSRNLAPPDAEQRSPDPPTLAELVAAPSHVVRVELSRLDELMRLVGELVISRARMQDVLTSSTAGSPRVWEALSEINTGMERQLRDLREGVMRVRLVPVGEVFERMRFVVREVAREARKQVVVTLEGQATEIDRLLVERMFEPLLHIVRNAVSHGVEDANVRIARGKPPEGRITLRASTSGERVLVEVEDDGAGIDVEAVAARAKANGLIAPDQILDATSLLDVLCAPGFSTRDEADLASGRGVGMAVVRGTIRALGGQLSLDTRAGEGTLFTIELPLTLMIVDALLVLVAEQTMAVPQPTLLEVLQVETPAIVSFENNEVMRYRGGVLPLLRLRQLFGYPAADPSRVFYVLVVGSDFQRVGLVVDNLAGLREIVVRAIADPLIAVPGIAGAAELGDGRLSLILDVAELGRLARATRGQTRPLRRVVAR